jgi:hypothetical protein
MTTTPYAKILTSVNGAAAVAGYAGAVPSGATIQLSAESTSGWESARWEIYGYPPGWPTPSGWTLEASGLIVSTDYTPTLITLEAATTRWGKWLPRLAVDGRTKNGIYPNPEVVDESAGWHVLSPGLGLEDIALGEAGQADAFRLWVGGVQKSFRSLESGPLGDGYKRIQTTNATQTTLATLAIPDNSLVVVQAFVGAKRPANATSAFFSKQRVFYRNGGNVTAVAAQSDLGSELGGTTWLVDLNASGTNVLVQVTGAAATTINWFGDCKSLLLKDTP